MKKRIFVAAFTFFFLLSLCVILVGNFDLFMTQGYEACTLQPGLLLKQLFSPQAGKLFLLFAALSALVVLWALFGHSYLNYRSTMYEVVPGFEIPTPEGQGQYGTAWWMEKKDYDRHFPSTLTAVPVLLSPDLAEHYSNERRKVFESNL